MFSVQNYNIKNSKNDILSGTVVAIALVPEAIAFAFIAGVSPQVGLYTAFILGFFGALLGGRAGMISGATGAVAVVFVALVASHGLEYLLFTTILAGLIQIIIGVLKFGKFIRLVPQPAIFGFVNGLAVVIASSQFIYFKDEGIVMVSLVLLTMLIIHFMPKVTKTIPSTLIAIIVVSFICIYFDIDTKNIGSITNISGNFPSFHIPDVPFSLETFIIVLPYAIIVALVGLIESLLTLSILDDMSGIRGSGNKECIAQGVGNSVCGLFGGMAGCVMVGQSIINYTSGGLGRLSGIFASILVILFVVSFSQYISMIPLAVIVGIMFMVSIATFEWSSFHRLRYMQKEDIIVMILTTIITIFADLAIAVITGVIISALVFAWKHAKIYASTKIEDNGTKIYMLDGLLFFGSTTSFSEVFDYKKDPSNVIIDFKNARVLDGSGAQAIDNITKRYQDNGKNIKIRHLSNDCKIILQYAGPYCTYEEDDPTYMVSRNY